MGKTVKPYIGITGFMTKEEVMDVLKEAPLMTNRLVMIGVLMSFKGLLGIQNNQLNRYPKVSRIADIFPDNDYHNTLNLIHYQTKEMDTIVRQLNLVTKFGGENMHGFQLNIAWPSPIDLTVYRKEYPEKIIVLQIGEQAFKEANYLPEKLVRKIAEYEGIADYILLDQSGGRGKPFNLNYMRSCLFSIREKNIGIGLGVAGGLNPTSLNILRPLVKEFPDLSIDAEDGIRDENDCLDLHLTREYIQKASRILC